MTGPDPQRVGQSLRGGPPSAPAGSTAGDAERPPDAWAAGALDAALARHLLGGRLTGDVGQALVALLTLYLFRANVPRGAALTWAGVFLAVTVGRGAYRRAVVSRIHEPGRRIAAVRGDVWLSGLLWGAWALLLVGADVQALSLLLVVFAGLMAAATSTLVADAPSFLGFSAALLVPAAVAVLASGTSVVHLELVALIALYGPFMVTVFRRAHALLVGQIVNAQRLRESREEAARGRDFLDAIFSSAPSAIVVLDVGGRVRRASPALERMLGFTEEEVAGRPIGELAYDEREHGRIRAFLDAVRASGTSTLEVPMRRVTGDRVWLRLSGTVAERLEDALILVAEDVSEQVVAREARERARIAAEQATRAKTSFLASMSHEIRTPMNGILGMIELLLDTELDLDQRQSAEVIRSSGRGLLRILNDILDISKMEAGQLDLEEVEFSLSEMLNETTHLHRMAASSRGIELVARLEEGVPDSVTGDPVRMRQVLSNLVSNALKFTEVGRVTIDVCSAPDVPNGVRFSVVDTGIGIPGEKLQKIFEEFEQADSSTTRRYGGVGLGLAISRRLVTLMGGSIEVESVPEGGSRFDFTVPLPPARSRSSRERRSSGTGVSGQRYLVVSPSPVERRLVREVLVRARASEVVEVGSTELALQELSSASTEGFAAVIADHHPPEADGLELARTTDQARARTGARVLVLTTGGVTFDPDALRRAGVAGVLTKPVTRTALVGALNELLSWTPPGGPERRLVTDRTPIRADADARILLVEDNAVNLQVALSLLRKRGYQVTTATDGAAAVEVAQREPFDLILMDIQMPVMDGFEAVQRIRALPAHANTPVAALTAHAFQEERERCREVGMDDFLSKPFAPADLYALTERWTGPGAHARGAASGEPRAGGGLEPRPEASPAVDVDAFRRAMRAAGVEDVVDAAMAVYSDEAPGLFSRLEAAVAAGDAEGIRLHAHSLKSSSANIRANRLADALRTLEHHGRDGETEAARGLLPTIRDELEAALDQIRRDGGG